MKITSTKELLLNIMQISRFSCVETLRDSCSMSGSEAQQGNALSNDQRGLNLLLSKCQCMTHPRVSRPALLSNCDDSRPHAFELCRRIVIVTKSAELKTKI